MSVQLATVSFGALLVSWMISMLLGYLHLKVMKHAKVYQPINPDTPSSHQLKEGTPSLGGLFFLSGMTISALIFGQSNQPYLFIPLISCWVFALIGLLDDIAKFVRKAPVGLKTSRKLAMQVLAAALVLWLVSHFSALQLSTVVHPWNPTVSWNIGLWYPIIFLLYMVSFVNAVNISDGLDGLVAQVSLSPLALIAALAALFAGGFHRFHVQSPIYEGGASLLILAASAIGGMLAFLWYNCPKAQLFMGDTGSHAVGALIGVSALLLKVELTIVVACAVFMAELLSSFIQIIAIRFFGKKIFLLAPLHHHYEKKGKGETKIVTRMQIFSTVATAVSALLFFLTYR